MTSIVPLPASSGRILGENILVHAFRAGHRAGRAYEHRTPLHPSLRSAVMAGSGWQIPALKPSRPVQLRGLVMVKASAHSLSHVA